MNKSLEIPDPNDILNIEDVATRLRQFTPDGQPDIGWVREKIRRRCPNPMPCHNVGKHLVFLWSEISQWILSSARPTAVRMPKRQSK